jgi:hypothetical protein
MGIGCFITIIASFVQAFSPYHGIGVFIFGRVLIGIGQGIALSEFQTTIGDHLMLTLFSGWPCLHRRNYTF